METWFVVPPSSGGVLCVCSPKAARAHAFASSSFGEIYPWPQELWTLDHYICVRYWYKSASAVTCFVTTEILQIGGSGGSTVVYESPDDADDADDAVDADTGSFCE